MTLISVWSFSFVQWFLHRFVRDSLKLSSNILNQIKKYKVLNRDNICILPYDYVYH